MASWSWCLILKYVSPKKINIKHWGLCSRLKLTFFYRERSKTHRHVWLRMAWRETIRQSEGIADRLDGKVRRKKRELHRNKSEECEAADWRGEIRGWAASLPPSNQAVAVLTLCVRDEGNLRKSLFNKCDPFLKKKKGNIGISLPYHSFNTFHKLATAKGSQQRLPVLNKCLKCFLWKSKEFINVSTCKPASSQTWDVWWPTF